MIKTFNLPILLFLALVTRIQHRSGYGRTAARISLRTKQAFDSIPRGFGWDGAVDGLGKVFERQLTEAAIVVPALDNDDDASIRTREHNPGSPRPRHQNGRPARSKTLPSQHARMGSLGSPLAKMFRVPEDPPEGTDEKLQPAGGGLEKSVVARLEAIESALAILVGEITRNSDAEEAPKLPLTSLSGAVEQSYSGSD